MSTELRVLHREDDWVAVDKPAGWLVHRTALDAHDATAVLQTLRDQLGQSVWPVHRLDKGTSGVLLLALSAESAGALSRLWAQQQVDKRYLALVRGWPSAQSGCITHPLAADPERPSTGQPHREARTDWRCLAQHTLPVSDGRHATLRVALLEAQPLTGRRQQIRRHFKHIAHPLIGDATHGKGPLNRTVAAHLGVQRLWLHAHTLRLPWNGTLRTLVAPPDAAWQTFLPAPLASG